MDVHRLPLGSKGTGPSRDLLTLQRVLGENTGNVTRYDGQQLRIPPRTESARFFCRHDVTFLLRRRHTHNKPLILLSPASRVDRFFHSVCTF
jgi:hypothetical protein